MSDEHHVAIVSFEGALKREIKRLREQLKQIEDLSQFKLTITVSGRVHDGEVELSYGLGESMYGTGEVEGSALQSVLDEFMRRHGWNKINKPKAIAYNKIIGDDEIPF